MEPGWHYAHNRMRYTIQLNRLADDLRVCLKTLLPQTVCKDHDAVAALILLFGKEYPTQ